MLLSAEVSMTLRFQYEDGKTPLDLATSIKFSGETVGAVEYSDEFREMWTVEADKHMVFRITKSLFQAE